MNTEHILNSPSLIWVYTDSLSNQLDAATWLDTTQELRRLGWKVSLITAGQKGQKEINGVEVTTIPKKNVYLIRQFIFHLQVLNLIFRSWNSLDIILFHQMSAPWFLPLRGIRKFLGKSRPLVVMDTRTLPMIPKESAGFKDRLRNNFDGLMNRLANRMADGQTAITKRMAEVMKIPQDQLLGIWPSGVDLDVFKPAQQMRDWDSISGKIQLIYIGALHVQRKLMVMCQAVEAANASGMNFTFSLIGWGSEQEQLTKFAEKSEGRIRVLPAVAHDRIPGLLAQAHVGVLPFPDQERFRVSSPIKLFEYMASGLPILATKIVCHTDVIKKGEYAFWSEGVSLKEHSQALTQIWECREQLPLLGQMAAADSFDWSWQSSAKKLDAALRSALPLKTLEGDIHT